MDIFLRKNGAEGEKRRALTKNRAEGRGRWVGESSQQDILFEPPKYHFLQSKGQ